MKYMGLKQMADFTEESSDFIDVSRTVAEITLNINSVHTFGTVIVILAVQHSILELKLCPENKQEMKTAEVKPEQSLTKGEKKQHLEMSMGLRFLDIPEIYSEVFATKFIFLFTYLSIICNCFYLIVFLFFIDALTILYTNDHANKVL